MTIVERVLNAIGVIFLVIACITSIIGLLRIISKHAEEKPYSKFWSFSYRHSFLAVVIFVIIFIGGGAYLSTYFSGEIRQSAYYESGYTDGYDAGYTDGDEGLVYDCEYSGVDKSRLDSKIASYEIVNPYTGKAFDTMDEFWQYAEQYKAEMEKLK